MTHGDPRNGRTAVAAIAVVLTVAGAVALWWIAEAMTAPVPAGGMPVVLSGETGQHDGPTPDHRAPARPAHNRAPARPAHNHTPARPAPGADVPEPSTSVARPTGVRIPAIGVAASDLQPLGVRDDGALEVPQDPQRAGWWRSGPEPGEPGPAVIVGHVDSRAGPGVFFRLREVTAGDRIIVDRADGTTGTFRVVRVEQHPKDRFPTQAVYGPIDGPALRLVTCGGAFDDGSGHYLDNIVVFARAI